MKVIVGIASIFVGILAARFYAFLTMVMSGYSRGSDIPTFDKIFAFFVMISVALVTVSILETSRNILIIAEDLQSIKETASEKK
jgi:hypothetical protein